MAVLQAIRSHMSQQAQTLELIGNYYAAFNAGNKSAMLDLMRDDVAHDINMGGREIGREAFRAFNERMTRCYREVLRDLVIMASADGRHAAAEFVVHGTYLAADEGLPPAHGQTYTLPAGAFFAIEDGRIARVTMYYNLQDWLDQVSKA
jgi:steroid delta-isomerase-like uncharacterized protein